MFELVFINNKRVSTTFHISLAVKIELIGYITHLVTVIRIN